MTLGTIIDTHSGDLKTTIVDQVEKMERPLAHLLPEMTANILGHVSIFIYLLILDWRMDLLSFVSIPVGMFFMSLIIKGYAEDYSKPVATNIEMNKTIVEYFGDINCYLAKDNQGGYRYIEHYLDSWEEIIIGQFNKHYLPGDHYSIIEYENTS